MARQKQIAQKSGRPTLDRLENEDIAFIKAQVAQSNTSKMFAAAQFHREVYDEATKGNYAGLRLPADVESVKSAFAGAFKPDRSKRDSLPELYYRVLESLYGIDRDSLPSRITVTGGPSLKQKIAGDAVSLTPTTPGPQQPIADLARISGEKKEPLLEARPGVEAIINRELNNTLARLELETDSELVAREAAGLIADCEYFIHTRTSQRNMLRTAHRTLEAVTRLARIKLDLASDVCLQQQWAELLVTGLASLVACHNHVGSIGPQDEIEKEISEVLAKNARLLPGSFVQKTELLHAIKVRTLNRLFNDYRFKQAANVLTCDIQAREQLIPNGVADELLGKMFGSIGQAYAFISRTDAPKSKLAAEYLEKSLVHFEPGTYFHSMSVNFLATLAWQEGNLNLACQSMGRHPGLRRLVNMEEFGRGFRDYFFQQNLSAFDVVNYARILGLCEANTVSKKNLREVVNYWNARLLDEHPHEQLAKWLAYTLYQSGDVLGAIELCKRGIEISQKLEHTVQTIGLSILGLLAACYANQQETALHRDTVAEFHTWASNLAGRSGSFRDYLGHFGGIGGLHDWLKNPTRDNVANITRFLPFTYA